MDSIILQVNPPTVSWVSVMPSVIAALISFAAIVFNWLTTRKTLEANRQNIERTLAANKETAVLNISSKRVEERKAEIYKLLNELYGPFSQYRKQSNLLFEKFKIGKVPNSPSGRFNTLIYLLQNEGPGLLETNDKILLREIIALGGLCENLIKAKAGLIDDDELREKWFPLAAQHYQIIRLAYEGAIKGEVDRFYDFKFPHQLDALLEERIKALKTELKNL